MKEKNNTNKQDDERLETSIYDEFIGVIWISVIPLALIA